PLLVVTTGSQAEGQRQDEQQAEQHRGPSAAGGRRCRSHSESMPPRAAGRAFATMAAMSLPTTEQVTEKLRAVIDPELRRNIVELGMVRAIDIAEDGRVGVIVSLTT